MVWWSSSMLAHRFARSASGRRIERISKPETRLTQVLPRESTVSISFPFQPSALGELLLQHGGEALHLLLEQLAVLLGLFGADVASRRQDVAV